MSSILKIKPDLNFIRKIKAQGGAELKDCYQCATCSVVCNLSPSDSPFPRKEMLWVSWGLKDKLMCDPDLWLCYQCNDCSLKCPRGARPGDVMNAIRKFAFENFAFPAFMGKALSQPRALFPLLIVPAILLFIILMLIHSGSLAFFHNHPIIYDKFFPQKYLEILFMGGNALVFLFAAVGLVKFWRGLNSSLTTSKGPGLVSSLVASLVDIISHRDFFDCEANKGRSWGHIMIFAGFLGAMATAGLAVSLTVVFPIMSSPINLPNPVKILGVVSGFAMLIGWLLIYHRRLNLPEASGRSEYSDWLFLNMIFIVALTGMLTFVFRILNYPYLAYPTYFVHLVVVFFLLWYAPYSKFAHMFYRALALIWAKNAGRVRQPKAI